jgi:two-component system, NtrC family, response regulator
VIAATNADLKKAMSAGTFREDLYYRLAVVQIEMPPLRDRENDIRLLAQFFLQRFSLQVKKTGLTFDPGAVRALINHSWPGNVRELENCIRRAIIMAEGKRLTSQNLELSPETGPKAVTLKEAREAAEREIIERVMRKNSGKITAAAAELEISRPTLYELLEKLGMAKE